MIDMFRFLEAKLARTYSPERAKSYREEDARAEDWLHRECAQWHLVEAVAGSFSEPIAVLDIGCGTGRYFNAYANAKSVASQPDSFAMDFTDVICPRAPCETERDGYVLYRDDSHLTARFSRSLGEPLLRGVKEYAARRPASRVTELIVGRPLSPDFSITSQNDAVRAAVGHDN